MRLLFSALLVSVALIASAATPTPTTATGCMLVEVKDGFTLLTNKCTDTINAFWVYEGECASGCSKKLAARAYYYVPLLKEPYHLSACFAPQIVDPTWKGDGTPACKDE